MSSTFTPGAIAPAGSVTVPCTAPVAAVWALADTPQTRVPNAATTRTKIAGNFFMVPPHPSQRGGYEQRRLHDTPAAEGCRKHYHCHYRQGTTSPSVNATTPGQGPGEPGRDGD